MKISKAKRNEAFINFIYSLDDKIKNELIKYNIEINADQDYIINLIIEKKIKINAEFISFFTTFQMLIYHINNKRKTRVNFEQYLIGYAMENDVL